MLWGLERVNRKEEGSEMEVENAGEFHGIEVYPPKMYPLTFMMLRVGPLLLQREWKAVIETPSLQNI